MSHHVTRRGFLASAAALGAALTMPGRASAGAGRRSRRPETYFELVLTGRKLESPHLTRDGLETSVRVLLGSAAGASNSLVYVAEGGSMLVDVATSPLGKRMVEDAAAVGGPFGEQSSGRGRDAIVVNTHHHADHTGGNWALGAFGPRPRVIMHVRADERVRGMVERYRSQASGGVRAAEQIGDPERRDRAVASAEAFAARAADLVAEDFGADETCDADQYGFSIGDRPVVLHHFGAGHTDNDVVVHLPEENVVHCGDLLFAKMHPYFADDSGSSCLGWAASVARIIRLCDAATVVVPGHGPVCDIAELKRQQAYLEALWEAVTAEVDKGTSREDATAKNWGFMQGLEREQLRARAIGAVYDEVLASAR